MFRSSGLVLCVVVMAAFVFGCGGGGGGTPPDPPDVVTPPPTDAQRIAEAQQMVATILSNAQARAEAASTAASALETNQDATADQSARAGNHNTAAQAALARIVSANTAAQAATTLAAAQTALTNAQTAQNTLNREASAIVSIRNAVQTVTNARMRREMDQIALTNNSSLIQHLRDNKLLSNAVLGPAGANLTAAASIVVGPAGNEGALDSGVRAACTAPCAEHPLYTGTGAGADRVTGQRTVRVGPSGGTLTSSSTTPTLSGTGRLPHGFDLKNADNTTFVNAYTDIRRERQGTRTDVTADNATTPYDERYNYILDTDYLLAGIWMTVDNAALGNSRITAFAYGSQPIAATDNFCVGTENGGTDGNTTRKCEDTTGLNSISSFVDDGKDFTATYRGNANGAYLAGSDSSYFTGDVTLTAEFQNPLTGASTGSIVGEVTNIVAGGQSMAGSIELQKQDLGDNIGGAFEAGVAVGVVDDKSFNGNWKGQFFGYEVTRSTATVRDTTANPVTTTITTTYSPQAPGSVAGSFYATQQSAPTGEAAFIGSFGAHR